MRGGAPRRRGGAARPRAPTPPTARLLAANPGRRDLPVPHPAQRHPAFPANTLRFAPPWGPGSAATDSLPCHARGYCVGGCHLATASSAPIERPGSAAQLERKPVGHRCKQPIAAPKDSQEVHEPETHFYQFCNVKVLGAHCARWHSSRRYGPTLQFSTALESWLLCQCWFVSKGESAHPLCGSWATTHRMECKRSNKHSSQSSPSFSSAVNRFHVCLRAPRASRFPPPPPVLLAPLMDKTPASAPLLEGTMLFSISSYIASAFCRPVRSPEATAFFTEEILAERTPNVPRIAELHKMPCNCT